VLVSGTTGVNPSTGTMAGDSIQAQTRQALANCEAILHAGGASLDDVVEVGVLLSNPAPLRKAYLWRAALPKISACRTGPRC
jgi:2-iminobutanoate/2-iminopropanoate deaminase